MMVDTLSGVSCHSAIPGLPIFWPKVRLNPSIADEALPSLIAVAWQTLRKATMILRK
jgi:hypothetical protein